MHGRERIVSVDITHLVRAALAGASVTDGSAGAAPTPEALDHAGSPQDAG